MAVRRWLWRSAVVLAIAWGTATAFACVAVGSGRSTGLERWLNVTSTPGPAEAIVCIGGGTMNHDLPTADGWQRIHASVQLFADGYAPLVVFTGRGNAKVSEAEIYADAAKWLGLPAAAIALDPLPASTAEHPRALLASMNGRIGTGSRLLLVTSSLHSRRVLMTFRRSGFSNVTVISDHVAKAALPQTMRRQQSALTAFKQDNKAYADPLFNLAQGSSVVFTALREWAALAVYRMKGLV